MFLDFYGLREQPFGVTPDPRYLYLSGTHREALASLFYGIQTGRGFQALIAKPGMGKTTLLNQLLARLRSSARTVYLFQSQCNSRELFRYVLADLGFDTSEQDLVGMHQQLNQVLLREIRAGRRFVLVVDEAQNLEDSVLETLRLMSNFETPRTKLLQIVLAGQPQLANKLARPGLAQLRQRIAILCRLSPFGPAEVSRYIDHRLEVAGHRGGSLFTPRARAMIVVQSQGIPRNINNLCFNALSLGYALKCKKIDSDIVQEVVADLDLDSAARESRPVSRPIAADPPALPPLSCRPSGNGGFKRWAIQAAVLAAVLFLPGNISVSPPAKPGSMTSGGLLPAAIRDGGASKASSSSTFAVLVQPEQWLQQISRQYLGQDDPKLIDEVLELNPQIADPNHIEVGWRVQLPAPPVSTTTFLEVQLEKARQELQKQEERIAQFKLHNLGALPEQASGNLQVLAGLNNQLQKIRARVNSARERRTYLEPLLTEYLSMAVGATLSTGEAEDKKLAQLRREREALLVRYTLRHPDVLRIDQEILQAEALRARLEEERKEAETGEPEDQSDASTASRAANPRIAQLESELKANQMTIDKLLKAEEELQQKIKAYQRRPVPEQQRRVDSMQTNMAANSKLP